MSRPKGEALGEGKASEISAAVTENPEAAMPAKASLYEAPGTDLDEGIADYVQENKEVPGKEVPDSGYVSAVEVDEPFYASLDGTQIRDPEAALDSEYVTSAEARAESPYSLLDGTQRRDPEAALDSGYVSTNTDESFGTAPDYEVPQTLNLGDGLGQESNSDPLYEDPDRESQADEASIGGVEDIYSDVRRDGVPREGLASQSSVESAPAQAVVSRPKLLNPEEMEAARTAQELQSKVSAAAEEGKGVLNPLSKSVAQNTTVNLDRRRAVESQFESLGDNIQQEMMSFFEQGIAADDGSDSLTSAFFNLGKEALSDTKDKNPLETVGKIFGAFKESGKEVSSQLVKPKEGEAGLGDSDRYSGFLNDASKLGGAVGKKSGSMFQDYQKKISRGLAEALSAGDQDQVEEGQGVGQGQGGGAKKEEGKGRSKGDSKKGDASNDDKKYEAVGEVAKAAAGAAAVLALVLSGAIFLGALVAIAMVVYNMSKDNNKSKGGERGQGGGRIEELLEDVEGQGLSPKGRQRLGGAIESVGNAIEEFFGKDGQESVGQGGQGVGAQRTGGSLEEGMGNAEKAIASHQNETVRLALSDLQAMSDQLNAARSNLQVKQAGLGVGDQEQDVAAAQEAPQGVALDEGLGGETEVDEAQVVEGAAASLDQTLPTQSLNNVLSQGGVSAAQSGEVQAQAQEGAAREDGGVSAAQSSEGQESVAQNSAEVEAEASATENDGQQSWVQRVGSRSSSVNAKPGAADQAADADLAGGRG